jgi:hypothetical protein
MKIIINRLAIFGLIIFFTASALGAQNPDEALVRIENIHQQTADLQCQVNHLRAELIKLEHKKNAPCRRVVCPRPCWWRSCFWGSPYGYPWGMNPKCQKDCESIFNGGTETGFGENHRDDFARLWGSPQNLLLLAAMGSTVTTSPFLGLRSAFDASDLIVNLPTMNEDLRFLKEHVEIDKKLKCYGIHLPDRPIIELGGKIEGLAFVQEDWNGGATTSDIDLATVRLDILVEVSRGVHAFMALNMDNATFNLLNNVESDVQLAGAQSRVFNSRVFVSRAFVTLGDLDRFPIYFTIGQMFLPFGRYASNMVTTVLTIPVARTNERAILLGFYKEGFYASVYTFQGESMSDSPGINEWGINGGYEKTWKKGSLNVGVGYISSISDSTGMQVTGASNGFFGFGINGATELLRHRVPAYDVHGEFALGKFTLFGEYIWAGRRFYVCDLSFNNKGARPTASNVELAYNFKLFNRPTSIAAGYGTTSEALALALPKGSFMSVFNISLWKNTSESFEFRHDTNYRSSDIAGGLGAVPPTVFSAGGNRNTYTFQVGVYF